MSKKSEARFIIKAYDRTKVAFKSVRKGLGKTTSALTSMQAKILGVAGVGGMGLLVTASFRSANALKEQADKLNINVKALGGYGYAAQQSGSSQQVMNIAMERAIKRLGEARHGMGSATTMLKKLNLTTEELAGLTPDELMDRYATSIGGMNTQGEKLAAISALMGDESRELITLFEAGPDAIAKYRAEAEALGYAMDDVAATKIQAAMDALNRSQVVMQGVGNTIAVELSPYLSAAADTFADMAVSSHGFKNEIVSGFESIATAVSYVGNVFRGLNLIWKGLELGWLEFKTQYLTGLAEVNRLSVEAMNMLPGVSLSVNMEIQRNALSSQIALSEARVAMSDLAHAPLPSDNIKEFFSAIREQAETAAQSEKALTDTAKKGADSRVGITQQEWKAKNKIYTSMADNLASLMSSKSRQLFEIGKIAAVSSSLLKAREAIPAAYAEGTKIGGPILGAAYAFTAGIATASQVAAVAGTQFGGGGSVTAEGGGSPGTAPIPTPPALQQAQDINVTVRVEAAAGLVANATADANRYNTIPA